MLSFQQLLLLSGFGSLTLLGVVYMILRHREQAREQKGESRADKARPAAARYITTGPVDINRLLRDAERELARTRVFRHRRLWSVPVVLVAGRESSGKTSLILNSGVDAYPLAAENKQRAPIARTEGLNVWLVGNAVTIDIPESIWSNPACVSAIARRLRYPAWRAIFPQRSAAPRTVIACMLAGILGDDGSLVDERSRTVMALNGFLTQMSGELGTTLPVHAVFTHTDAVAGFSRLFQNIRDEEAKEALGAVLDYQQLADRNNYVATVREAVDVRLSELAEFQRKKRTLLQHEGPTEDAWVAFEFAGKLATMRESLTSALTALCSLAPLDTNPLLRGFYFTGTRKLARREEWIFSSRFLGEVVLADQAAAMISGQSRTRSRVLTGLCWTGTVLGAVVVGGLLTSLLRNGSLERRLSETGSAVRQGLTARSQPATFESLMRFGPPVHTLAGLMKDTPLSYRWGLFTGKRLFAPARREFCSALKFAVLDSASRAMENELAQANSSTDYDALYGTLKASLMMSSYPQYAKAGFLGRELARHSPGGGPDLKDPGFQSVVETYVGLAGTPEETESCLLPLNLAAIRNAQSVLQARNPDDGLYADLKARARKDIGPIDYNLLHSNEAVHDGYAVPGEFSAGAWTLMQGMLQQPQELKVAEPWVLGGAASTAPSAADAAAVSERLRKRYENDYTDAWKKYLDQASVAHFADLKDASNKLDPIGSGRALAWLFSIATEHTSVGSPISEIFQPVHDIVPKRGDFAANKPYLEGLVGIKVLLDQSLRQTGVTRDQGFDQVRARVRDLVTYVTNATSPRSTDDTISARVRQLLTEPLVQLDPLMRSEGVNALAGASASVCAAYNSMYAKFPFQPRAKTSAGREEVQNLLQPSENPLMGFYTASLMDSVALNPSSGFALKLSPAVRVRPEFLQFLNRVWQHGRILYGDPGDPGIRLTLTLREEPGGTLQGVNIIADDIKYRLTPGSTTTITWSLRRSANLTIETEFSDIQAPPQKTQPDDPWAIFRWLYGSEVPTAEPLKWKLGWNSLDRSDAGHFYRIDVRFADGSPFDSRKLAGLPCTPPAAK